jgi:hypothetical protein
MDTKKFEQLMDLVINEDNDRAQELFHEIVVEKSREIFESIMAEEMDEDMMEDDMDGGMGGMAGDLLDEINAEETEEGMYEEEEDIDFGDEEVEFGSDEDAEGEEGGDEVEDAVIRIEDKLDQLMAEFEDIMGGGDAEGDMDADMDFGGDAEGDEDADMDFDAEGDDEEAMMEAIQLKKISVTHGDNGVQTKSPGLQGSGQAGMDSHPVKFSGAAESVPTAPKAPSNFYSKGETSVKGAGNFKNAPGKDNFKDKGEAAPKPKHGDDGAHTRSPVAESRRSARRPIR